MTVLDVGKCISMMANDKSTGRDNIGPCLLKLALPYIVQPLTHIYNLSIQKNVFPTVLKKAKVIPLPKVKGIRNQTTFAPYPYSRYFQNRFKDMYTSTYLSF